MCVCVYRCVAPQLSLQCHADIILNILVYSRVIIISSFNSIIISFFPALLASNNLFCFPAPELEAGFCTSTRLKLSQWLPAGLPEKVGMVQVEDFIIMSSKCLNQCSSLNLSSFLGHFLETPGLTLVAASCFLGHMTSWLFLSGGSFWLLSLQS